MTAPLDERVREWFGTTPGVTMEVEEALAAVVGAAQPLDVWDVLTQFPPGTDLETVMIWTRSSTNSPLITITYGDCKRLHDALPKLDEVLHD